MNYYIYSKALSGNRKYDENGMEINAWIGFATEEEYRRLRDNNLLWLLGDTQYNELNVFKIREYLEYMGELADDVTDEYAIHSFISFLEKQEASPGFNAFGIITEECVLFEPLEFLKIYFPDYIEKYRIWNVKKDSSSVHKQEPDDRLTVLFAKEILYEYSKVYSKETLLSVLKQAIKELADV
jgi:hypothetical protein